MSENHISSCIPVIESNIPIPKRVLAEAKRSKGCTRLPELQKYIDTIIKASNHCDPNSESNREKANKEKKLGRHSLPKGFNNKFKLDKLRMDMAPNRRKTLGAPRSPTPEGGRNEDTPNSFVSGFEDPRNWKFNKVQNSNFSLKVERFLKELYPNPYHLDSLTEFHGLRGVPGAATEELITEHLATIDHYPIIQEKPESELELENKDSITAVVEINATDRDTSTENPDLETGSEKCTTLEPSESADTIRGSTPTEVHSEPKPSSSKSRIRKTVPTPLEPPSSPPDSLINPRKRANLKVNRKWGSKETLESIKSKSSTLAFGEERTDHDIGKLMLLSRSDSDASMPRRNKEVKLKKWETEEALKKSTSKIYKQNEMNDLKKIQEVMTKANKSFIMLSEKNPTPEPSSPEKAVPGDNLVESSRSKERDLQNDMRKAIHEEREKHITIKHDHDAIDIRSKMIPETKSLSFESGFPKQLPTNFSSPRDNISVKSEPDRTRGTEIQASARKISKTVLDLKQSLSNIEQRIKEKVKTEDAHTSQKIGEVLEFMYDCLMKFSGSEDLAQDGESSASLVRRIFSTNQIVQPSTSKVSDEAEAFFRVPSHNAQNIPQGVGALLESRKRHRVRCRRSELALQIENKQDETSPPPTANPDCQLNLFMNSDVNIETHIPTVETQNELGGCSELTSEERAPSESVRPTKPVSPIPGKLNRSRADPRNLREVLETEEKLFASREYNQKERTEKVRSKEFLTCKMGDEFRISEPGTGFKCPNSNFVICVNSLPRNIKTFTAVTPVIAIPQCPQMPVIGVREHRDMKPMAFKSEFSLKEFYASTEINYQVLTCTYRLKQGSVFQMNKLTVEYIAVPVCEKIVSSTSALQCESSLKNSECFMSISTKSVKTSPKITKVSRSSLTIPTVKSSTESGINFESEDERRVDALVEAIEDAEGKILLLQQINESCRKENENANRNCRASQTVTAEPPDEDSKNKGERKKVQDLLVRTYNLQMKLQECMNKITGLHPNTRQTTSKPQNSATDFSGYKYDKRNPSDTSVPETHLKRGNTYPLVHWYPITRRHPYVDEVTNISKVDHSTSYNPPPERKIKKPREEPPEQPPREPEKPRNDDDDRSSVCSFKSSNDFSLDSDFSVVKKELKVPEKNRQREHVEVRHREQPEVRQRDHTEVRQRDHTEVRQKDHPEVRQKEQIENRQKDFAKNVHRRDASPKDANAQEEESQNTVVQYDTKSPSKTLKTVFKGRDSSTELSIGLKDIPMTQVKNISVEKTKLTPNHTKISICISKDKSKEVRTSAASEVLQNKIPAYCYKHVPVSLKETPSEEDDDASKSSQSANEGSDDNEDDFKSVASTFDDSEIDHNLQKTSLKDHKIAKAPVVKKVPKHRFDFYQKMNTNAEETGVKSNAVSGSMCRYKELEPLKQAMTEMQIRMRSIKRDALFNSNDYYERALKLAKMSAGYCQSCGNRSVIPNDTFGYYKALVPRRCASRGFRHYKSSVSSNPSFYSFHSSNADMGEHICDLDIKHNSYLLNRTTHSNRTILRGPLQDMPVVFERM